MRAQKQRLHLCFVGGIEACAWRPAPCGGRHRPGFARCAHSAPAPARYGEQDAGRRSSARSFRMPASARPLPCMCSPFGGMRPSRRYLTAERQASFFSNNREDFGTDHEHVKMVRQNGPVTRLRLIFMNICLVRARMKSGQQAPAARYQCIPHPSCAMR